MLPEGARLELCRAERRSEGADFRAALRPQARLVLGRLIGLPDGQMPRLLHDSFGRPQLCPDRHPDWADADLSLSYSPAWVAVALCRGARIGVDLQQFLPRHHAAFTRRFAHLGPISCAQAQRLWLRMEALGKAQGRGLEEGFDWLLAQSQDPAMSGAFVCEQVLADGTGLALCHLPHQQQRPQPRKA